MSLIVHWFFGAAGFLLASRLLAPGFRVVGGFVSALVVAAIFGVVSTLVGWLVYGLLGFLTLGIGFLLGVITRTVTSALLLMLTAQLTSRLDVGGFGTALLAAVVVGAVTGIGDWLVRK
jgi:uncharacterized membrane protein YvlD (DUF360 family)